MTVTDNQFNDLSNTVSSIDDRVTVLETEIGVQPQGPYATVRARLDILESRIASGGGGGGGGSGDAVTLQGRPIAPTAPTNGQVLTWIGGDGEWEPANPSAGFTAGGDLSGTSTNQIVNRIHGTTVPSGFGAATGSLLQITSPNTFSYVTLGGDLGGSPSAAQVVKLNGNAVDNTVLGGGEDGFVLTWNNTDSKWEATAPAGGGSAGGDLTGTYPNPTVKQLTGANPIGIPSSSLSFGMTPGVSGKINFDHVIDGTFPLITSRNGSNTDDLLFLSTTPSVLAIGDPAYTHQTSIYSDNTLLLDANFSRLDLNASASVFGTGSLYKVTSNIYTVTTTDATETVLFTDSLNNNTVLDYSITVVARDASNNGDAYRADLFATFQEFSFTPSLVGAGASPQNVRTNGGGSAYAVTFGISGDGISLKVTGVAATTITWGVTVQTQLRG